MVDNERDACEMLVNLWMVKDVICFHRKLLSHKFQLVYNALLGFFWDFIFMCTNEGEKCNVVKNLEKSVIYIVNGQRAE